VGADARVAGSALSDELGDGWSAVKSSAAGFGLGSGGEADGGGIAFGPPTSLPGSCNRAAVGMLADAAPANSTDESALRRRTPQSARTLSALVMQSVGASAIKSAASPIRLIYSNGDGDPSLLPTRSWIASDSCGSDPQIRLACRPARKSGHNRLPRGWIPLTWNRRRNPQP